MLYLHARVCVMQNKDQQWLLEEKYSGNTNAPGYKEDLARLASGEPVAYVIGFQPFLGLKIYLDSKPLIPRPETEWWTEHLISFVLNAQKKKVEERDSASQSNFHPYGYFAASSAEKYAAPKMSFVAPVKILDLCAGSGAIGCAILSKIPNVEVSFGELDAIHKVTIEKNIQDNNLDIARAHVRIGDLFAPFADQAFDFIAVNPPYIPRNRVLEKSVSEYEPARALFSEDDGLGLIRRIAKELPHHLNKGGAAWIECDHTTIKAGKGLFEEVGFRVEICSDQYEVPRLLVVSFP